MREELKKLKALIGSEVQQWATVSVDSLPAIGFSHPRLQEVVLTWAESLGVTVLRPAKVVSVGDFDHPTVSVVGGDGRLTEYQARLVVGADGVRSSVRALAGIAGRVSPYGHAAVVANFACEHAHLGRAFQWFLPDGGVLAWLPLRST